MSVNHVFKNGVEEFGETLIMGALLGYSSEQVRKWSERIENPLLRDAVESSLQVISFGLVFQLIRMEEKVIDIIFDRLGVIVMGLYALPQSLSNKISAWGKKKKLFGRAGSSAVARIFDTQEKRIALAQNLTDQARNYLQARHNSSNSQGLYHSYIQTRDSVLRADSLKADLAKGINDQYLQTLMFKTLTSNFTPSDEQMLKKILGRENIGDIKIEDLNKMGEFMFAKDDAGHVVGLSKAFLELINGLGYLHNKGA